MATQEQIEVLSEHLPYEIQMLRYTYNQLGRAHFQLDWNAYLESFGIHARVLIDFFLNRADEHNRTLLCEDFLQNWAVPEKDGIDHFLTKVNQQIAHLGSTRTKEKAKKIGPTRAKKAKEWIEAALETFRKGLRGEMKELFEEAMVQLLEPDKLVAGEVAPTASSGGLMQVSTTSISQSIGIPSPIEKRRGL